MFQLFVSCAAVAPPVAVVLPIIKEASKKNPAEVLS
jgi:hypothetical protein